MRARRVEADWTFAALAVGAAAWLGAVVPWLVTRLFGVGGRPELLDAVVLYGCAFGAVGMAHAAAPRGRGLFATVVFLCGGLLLLLLALPALLLDTPWRIEVCGLLLAGATGGLSALAASVAVARLR